MAPSLRMLKQKREQIVNKLKRFQEFVLQFDESQGPFQLKARLRKAEEAWIEFEGIQSDIESKDEAEMQDRQEFEALYFEVVAKAEECISNCEKSLKIQEAANNMQMKKTDTSNPAAKVKLPALNLQVFSGQYEEWQSFAELFKSLIHDNTNLNDVERFHYLRSSVRGDAAQIIESLEITSSNYEIAWGLLTQRYENKRFIIQGHIKSMFEFPKIEKESAVQLRRLLQTIKKHVQALQAMKMPTEAWDAVLVYTVTSKLDSVTRRDWEAQLTSTELPSFVQLTGFLENRCSMLEVMKDSSSKGQITTKFQSRTSTEARNKTAAIHIATNAPKCKMCSGDHYIFQCDTFKSKSAQDRAAEVRRLGLCMNCLRVGHMAKLCKGSLCKICNKRHNTLLHTEASDSTVSTNDLNASAEVFRPTSSAPTVVNTTSLTTCTKATHVMLATALVIVKDQSNRPHLCRALLDSASQPNLLSEKMATRLGLTSHREVLNTVGVGNRACKTEKTVKLEVQSRVNNYHTTLQCAVLPTITCPLPTVKANTRNWVIPENIQLADPGFNETEDIDLLIGGGIYFDLLQPGQLRPAKGYPVLQNTKLGWIVTGKIDVSSNPSLPTEQSVCQLTVMQSLDNQLKKFWETEDCGTLQHKYTEEEARCEKHFQETYQRLNNHFMVRLPFKENVSQLGESKNIAIRRWLQTEKRLSNQPKLLEAYNEFLEEYKELGHMESITAEQPSGSVTCYLPHQCVVREQATTTKVRVVFDASSKTSSGLSLNNTLMVGPKQQEDLFNIVLRFRQYPYALIADVEKMYRQVVVHPADQDAQRIVWRKSRSEPIQEFRLKTVTYGTSSAPFLATRCLKQIAVDVEENNPRIAKIIRRDFYMDDLLTGANTGAEIATLQTQLSQVLSDGGFHLRKWMSNDPGLLADGTIEGEAPELNSDYTVKSLGLRWSPSTDEFQLNTDILPSSDQVTKRSLISHIARIFDPLGVIGPVTFKAKVLLQKLWELKVDWDESLPLNLRKWWQQFATELAEVQTVKFPRQVSVPEAVRTELHGFCDASMQGYGACIYVVSYDSQGYRRSVLLCAKSRVAPLKQVTIPRLELCGALLLSKLIHKVQESLHESELPITLWSDSSIVLVWLSAPASQWKTYVANRVAQIQELTSNCTWKHVKTDQNPADIISRGLMPKELVASNLWWQGPVSLFYASDHTEVPTLPRPEQVPEFRPTVISMSVSVDLEFWTRYSSWNKLVRVLAYCRRFVSNCRKPMEARQSGLLTIEEVNATQDWLLREAQREALPSEYNALAKGEAIPKGSGVLSLHPFLDPNGVMRVGGRIDAANVGFESKHQIILPNKHPLTKVIIREEHQRHLHAGPQLLLATLRQRYWPIGGKRLIRSVLNRCITCFKANPRSVDQLMGQLPPERVTPSPPFTFCGVDYAGPIKVKEAHRRGARTGKAYVAVFVCFSTKAVHLELVGDMSSEAFLGALKRFFARRGKSRCLYSDNATTFTGAQHELGELKRLFESQPHLDKLRHLLDRESIEWKFIPPRAPNFGGLWEAAVKSMKFHLKRILGGAILTFEEVQTCLAQIEACLNSRPLSALSTDAGEISPLTPGHFLVGRPLTAPAEPDLQHLPVSHLSRWQYVQALMQQFWSRWSREYLSSLQQRFKWKRTQPNLKVGQVVLLKEENLPPFKWALGQIEDVHPGPDGLVRAVTIRTAASKFRRSIAKICPLPQD